MIEPLDIVIVVVVVSIGGLITYLAAWWCRDRFRSRNADMTNGEGAVNFDDLVVKPEGHAEFMYYGMSKQEVMAKVPTDLMAFDDPYRPKKQVYMKIERGDYKLENAIRAYLDSTGRFKYTFDKRLARFIVSLKKV